LIRDWTAVVLVPLIVRARWLRRIDVLVGMLVPALGPCLICKADPHVHYRHETVLLLLLARKIFTVVWDIPVGRERTWALRRPTSHRHSAEGMHISP
jgi:hypothetical protein